MSQLPADCLYEIFEHLEKNDFTLCSCLLINRRWCEVAVRILWRDIWNFNTLIYCLPNESKEILRKNRIIILNPTSKPPMFNYPTFCKVLKISHVNYRIEQILHYNQPLILSQNLNRDKYIIAQEIYKLFMNQVTSLNVLEYYYHSSNIEFISYPGSKDCLKHLSELHCHSNIDSEFFYRLSQICHNIQTLNISFGTNISNGLLDLISVQRNLKYLTMEAGWFDWMTGKQICCHKNLSNVLTKIPNTLIKLILYGYFIPFSSITKFTNLREFELSLNSDEALEDFKILQYATFSQLQILKIGDKCPRYDLLIKFLEINGKNLKEFYIHNSDDTLNLAISKFCPNLRKFSTRLKNNELDTLEIVFNNCKYLKRIGILCGHCYGTIEGIKEAMDVCNRYKNASELILDGVRSGLSREEVGYFFVSWKTKSPTNM